jgi:hypothetical protein
MTRRWQSCAWRDLEWLNDRDQDGPICVACYHGWMFHFGKPSTPGQWIGHILAAIVALFLVWWMLRLFII